MLKKFFAMLTGSSTMEVPSQAAQSLAEERRLAEEQRKAMEARRAAEHAMEVTKEQVGTIEEEPMDKKDGVDGQEEVAV